MQLEVPIDRLQTDISLVLQKNVGYLGLSGSNARPEAAYGDPGRGVESALWFLVLTQRTQQV